MWVLVQHYFKPRTTEEFHNSKVDHYYKHKQSLDFFMLLKEVLCTSRLQVFDQKTVKTVILR